MNDYINTCIKHSFCYSYIPNVDNINGLGMFGEFMVLGELYYYITVLNRGFIL